MKYQWTLSIEFPFLKHAWNLIPIFHHTPLIWAPYHGHSEIVQLLLSQPGIEINSKNILLQTVFLTLRFYIFLYISSKWFVVLNIIINYIILCFLLQQVDIRNCTTVIYTARYWYQQQRHLDAKIIHRFHFTDFIISRFYASYGIELSNSMKLL